MVIILAIGILKHAKVFGAYERCRTMWGAVRRGLSFWRRGSKWSVACWTVSEGSCASKDQLLGLRIADDNSIVMTENNLSTVP